MKIKWKNIILLIVFVISITFIIISFINIIKWNEDNKKTKEIIDKINMSIIKEVDENDNDSIEIIDSEEEESNPYWDYIKMNLIDVDFKELKEINRLTVGWIQVNGTNINYPVVRAYNNEYYLVHSFDNSYNNAGWVFMDYRNKISKLDRNTIIYAHGRKDNSMFGSLKNILENNWLNDTNNHIIKLSTEYQNTLWQVFSVYIIPTTNDYIQINFNSDDEFFEFINKLKDRSEFDFNTNVTNKDNILTLSTCYNDKEKVVLHAKLIKKETR